MSRLIEADYDSGDRIYNFNYDLAGNRLAELLSGTGVTPADRYFGYNAANQLIAEGDTLDMSGDVVADYTYEYDANGNLRFKKDTVPTTLETYTWDRANRLLTAPGSTSYQYDGMGNRIQQTVSSVVTDYLLDTQPGLAVVLQQTTSGNVDRFIHGPRGIHAQQDNSNDWFYPVQDGLGSVRGVADAVLAVQGMQHYEPYGTPFGAQGSLGMPFGFTGEQTDANDLVYLRARYLSPGLGVFASLDPFEGMAGRPMSLNGYSWVEGNVVNAVDASGRQIGGTCDLPLPCPHASLFVPPVDYSTRLYVDDSYAQRDWFIDLLNLLAGSSNPIRIGLAGAALRANDVGNINAARHLNHWLGNSGSELTLDVDQMLQDLPRWRKDVTENILNPTATDLLAKVTPDETFPGCKIYTNRATTSGFNPNSGQFDTWRRVGQGSRANPNIYSDGGISTKLDEPDFAGFHSDLPAGASYSRQELDWFLAMNAFDYSVSESLVVDALGNAQLCYRIYIADEYGWYFGVSPLDTTMAQLELQGVGTNYDIRGRSRVICEEFHVSDLTRSPDGRFNLVGP